MSTQNKLHPKILELKRRAAAVNYSNVSVNEAGELVERESLLDQRIVEGYAVIWGQRNLHGEKFIKGCFARSIRENGPGSGSKYEIKFLYNHDTNEPLSLFAELKEDATGLYFRTVALDDVPMADRVLKQLRSGTLNNYSQGFNFIWDANAIEWDDTDDSLVVKECKLFEVSVATIPSGMETYTIRSAEQVDDLLDDTEDFIQTLPRRQQLQARQLFARHKSLAEFEPLKQRAKALENGGPVGIGIDYDFLTKNFQL